MLFGQHVLPLILATSACAAAFSLDIASLKRAREKRELSHLCTTTQDCNYCNNYCNSQAMEVCHGRVCYPQPPASPPPSLPLPPKPPPSQPPCPPPPAILVVESVTSPPAVPPRLDIPIYWAGITPAAGAGGSNSSGEPIADVGQALTAPGGAGTLSYNHSAGLAEAGFSFRSVGDAHGASSAQLDENAHNDSGGLHVGGVLLYVFGSVLLLGIAYLAYIYKPWEKVKGTKYDVFSQPFSMAFGGAGGKGGPPPLDGVSSETIFGAGTPRPAAPPPPGGGGFGAPPPPPPDGGGFGAPPPPPPDGGGFGAPPPPPPEGKGGPPLPPPPPDAAPPPPPSPGGGMPSWAAAVQPSPRGPPPPRPISSSNGVGQAPVPDWLASAMAN